MSKGKKACIWIASIFAVLMIALCMWWLLVYLYAPDKFVSNTYNIGTITTADGSTTKNIVEVDYYTNANKNGLEKLDIRWNYYQDEDKDLIYSQGLQYVANSKNSKINFEYMVDEKGKEEISSKRSFLHTTKTYNIWGGYRLDESQASRYNYASDDDYATTFNATNPLSVNSILKIEVGGQIYGMKFKGLNTEASKVMYEESLTKSIFLTEKNNYYAYYDFDYFAYEVYNALQTDEFGVNQTILFEFGNRFDYFKYDETSKSYSETALDGNAAGKVIQEVKTYYSIKINISEDGAQTAEEDSIFNCIHGNSNFNINPNVVTEGYYIGRSIIDCKLGNFDLVTVYDNYVALKLNDNSYNDFIKYKNNIVLDVLIDIDKLEALGYKYFGLADDNRLDEFKIYQIYTQQTVDGEVVKTEVAL